MSTNVRFYLSHDINITEESHFGVETSRFDIFYAALLWTPLRNVAKYVILAYISIRIAVFTPCQMYENPCSNQEIHVLFELGFKLENN